MDREFWQRLEAVAEAALLKMPELRPPFLDEACAADTKLRLAVEELIEAHERADSFLEEPAIARLPDLELCEDKSELTTGEQVGPYRLLRRIGSRRHGDRLSGRALRRGIRKTSCDQDRPALL